MVNTGLRIGLHGARDARVRRVAAKQRIFATKSALTSKGQSNLTGQKSFWSNRFLVYYWGGGQVFAVGN